MTDTFSLKLSLRLPVIFPLARWHAWLHKMIDNPDKVPNAPTYGKPVTRNMSGKPGCYVPPGHRNAAGYNGPMAERFQAWDPAANVQVESDSGKDVLDLK
jgi:hypothetical protein